MSPYPRHLSPQGNKEGRMGGVEGAGEIDADAAASQCLAGIHVYGTQVVRKLWIIGNFKFNILALNFN